MNQDQAKVNSIEPKWTQVSLREPKWGKENPSEPKWIHVNPGEFKWTQVNLSKTYLNWIVPKCTQMNSTQVKESEPLLLISPISLL